MDDGPRLELRGVKKRGLDRGKEVWSARIDLRPTGGCERNRERFTFVGTEKEARRALAARLVDARRGIYVGRREQKRLAAEAAALRAKNDAEEITFGAYLADWLSLASTGRAAKTVERYEGMIRVHIAPRRGAIPMRRLSAPDLERAYADWLAAGLKPLTVRHHAACIHAVLAAAVRRGLLIQNVASIAERPRWTRRETRYIEAGEVGKLLLAAEIKSNVDTPRDFRGNALGPPPPYRELVALAFGIGARRGELVGLRWRDVDFATGRITIARSIEVTRKSGIQVKSPKTDRVRVVAVPKSVLDLLADLKDRRHAGPGDWLFPNALGSGPMCPDLVTDRTRTIFKLAGVKGSLHALRHAAASHMLRGGASVRDVAATLGHSTPTITLGTYGHLAPDSLDRAAAMLDTVVSPLLASVDARPPGP